MADYYIQFSCIFDVGTAENVAHAADIRQHLADTLEEDEGTDLGFDMEPDPTSGPGALWISPGAYGEPEHVIAFVLRCAAAFDLRGRWGFRWALTCSRPRLDGFGGGAQLLDLGARQSLAWIDCEHWVLDGLYSEAIPNGSIVALAPVGGASAIG